MDHRDDDRQDRSGAPNGATMLRIAAIAAIISAIGFGFTSAFTGVAEWIALLMLGFYLIGVLPSYLYLRAVIRAHKRTARKEAPGEHE